MERPLVSVIMPVYNAELFLRRAIDSIISQTYTNIEFIIVNDGSNDGSLQIIKSYVDKRIRLIENVVNKGLIYSLNTGIENATGKYIARMDADDKSYPKRLEKQVNYLEKHDKVGILGTFIQNESKFRIYRNSNLNSNDLKIRIIFSNIFNHPTIMFRSSFIKENKFYYDNDYKYAEDYNLWLNSIKYTDFAILNEQLFFYENHQNQVSIVFSEEQRQSVTKTHKHFFNSINLHYNDEEIELHRRLYYQDYFFNSTFLGDVEKWLLKISENLDLQRIAGKPALEKAISILWFEVCTHFSSKKIKTNTVFSSSALYKPKYISYRYKLTFFIKKFFY